MSETLDDSFDIEEAFPKIDDIKKRGDHWQSLFEKYSNCNDGEDEGLSLKDLDVLIEELEKKENKEEDLEYFSEAIEDNDDISDKENKKLAIYQSFSELSDEDKYKKVSYYFSPELIQGLFEGYQERLKEAEKQGLPFWFGISESGKVTESLSEQTIKTPNFEASTRMVQRSKELQRTQMAFHNNFQQTPSIYFDKFNLNGQPIYFNNSQVHPTMSDQMQLPDAIQKLIGSSGKFTMKVLERSYDICVDDSSFHNYKMLQKASRKKGPSRNVQEHDSPGKKLRLMNNETSRQISRFGGDSSDSDEITVVEHLMIKQEPSSSDVEFVDETFPSENVTKSNDAASKPMIQKPQMKEGKKDSDLIAVKIEPTSLKTSKAAPNHKEEFDKTITNETVKTNIVVTSTKPQQKQPKKTSKPVTNNADSSSIATKTKTSAEPKCSRATKAKATTSETVGEEKIVNKTVAINTKTEILKTEAPAATQKPSSSIAKVTTKKTRKRATVISDSSSDDDEILSNLVVNSKLQSPTRAKVTAKKTRKRATVISDSSSDEDEVMSNMVAKLPERVPVNIAKLERVFGSTIDDGSSKLPKKEEKLTNHEEMKKHNSTATSKTIPTETSKPKSQKTTKVPSKSAKPPRSKTVPSQSKQEKPQPTVNLPDPIPAPALSASPPTTSPAVTTAPALQTAPASAVTTAPAPALKLVPLSALLAAPIPKPTSHTKPQKTANPPKPAQIKNDPKIPSKAAQIESRVAESSAMAEDSSSSFESDDDFFLSPSTKAKRQEKMNRHLAKQGKLKEVTQIQQPKETAKVTVKEVEKVPPRKNQFFKNLIDSDSD